MSSSSEAHDGRAGLSSHRTTGSASQSHSRVPSAKNTQEANTRSSVAGGAPRLSVLDERAYRSTIQRHNQNGNGGDLSSHPGRDALSSAGSAGLPSDFPIAPMSDIHTVPLWFRDENGVIQYIDPSQADAMARRQSILAIRRLSRLSLRPPPRPSNVAPSAIPEVSRHLSPVPQTPGSPRPLSSNGNDKKKPSGGPTSVTSRSTVPGKKKGAVEPDKKAKGKAEKAATSSKKTTISTIQKAGIIKNSKTKLESKDAAPGITRIKKSTTSKADATGPPSISRPGAKEEKVAGNVVKGNKGKKSTGHKDEPSKLKRSMALMKNSIPSLTKEGEDDVLSPMLSFSLQQSMSKKNRRRSTVRALPQAGQVVDVKVLLGPTEEEKEAEEKKVREAAEAQASSSSIATNNISPSNTTSGLLSPSPSGIPKSHSQRSLRGLADQTRSGMVRSQTTPAFNPNDDEAIRLLEEQLAAELGLKSASVTGSGKSSSNLVRHSSQYGSLGNPKTPELGSSSRYASSIKLETSASPGRTTSFPSNAALNAGTQTLSFRSGSPQKRNKKGQAIVFQRPRAPQKPFIPQKGLYMERHIFPSIMTKTFPLPTNGRLAFGPYEDELAEIERKLQPTKSQYHAPEKYMFPLHAYGRHSKQRMEQLDRYIQCQEQEAEEERREATRVSLSLSRSTSTIIKRTLSENDFVSSSRITSTMSIATLASLAEEGADKVDSSMSSLEPGSRPITSYSRSTSRRASVRTPMLTNAGSLLPIHDSLEH